MAQTPRAGMSDSVGRFRRYRCSTLFNFDSNLSMCGTFLIKLLPQTPSIFVDYCHVTYNLNLRAATLNMWSFRIPTAIFCSKNCTILGSLPSPPPDHWYATITVVWARREFVAFDRCASGLSRTSQIRTNLNIYGTLMGRGASEESRTLRDSYCMEKHFWYVYTEMIRI